MRTVGPDKEAYNCCNCVYWRLTGEAQEESKGKSVTVFMGPCRFGPPPNWPIMPEYQFCGMWCGNFVPDGGMGMDYEDDLGDCPDGVST